MEIENIEIKAQSSHVWMAQIYDIVQHTQQ